MDDGADEAFWEGRVPMISDARTLVRLFFCMRKG